MRECSWRGARVPRRAPGTTSPREPPPPPFGLPPIKPTSAVLQPLPNSSVQPCQQSRTVWDAQNGAPPASPGPWLGSSTDGAPAGEQGGRRDITSPAALQARSRGRHSPTTGSALAAAMWSCASAIQLLQQRPLCRPSAGPSPWKCSSKPSSRGTRNCGVERRGRRQVGGGPGEDEHRAQPAAPASAPLCTPTHPAEAPENAPAAAHRLPGLCALPSQMPSPPPPSP